MNAREEAEASLAAFDAYWTDGGPVDPAYGRPYELIRALLAETQPPTTEWEYGREDEDLGRMAQRFYEASGLTIPHTSKPRVVAGLRAVLPPISEWEYKTEGASGSTNPLASRLGIRFRRRKAGPWEVVPDGE